MISIIILVILVAFTALILILGTGEMGLMDYLKARNLKLTYSFINACFWTAFLILYIHHYLDWLNDSFLGEFLDFIALPLFLVFFSIGYSGEDSIFIYIAVAIHIAILTGFSRVLYPTTIIEKYKNRKKD